MVREFMGEECTACMTAFKHNEPRVRYRTLVMHLACFYDYFVLHLRKKVVRDEEADAIQN